MLHKKEAGLARLAAWLAFTVLALCTVQGFGGWDYCNEIPPSSTFVYLDSSWLR